MKCYKKVVGLIISACLWGAIMTSHSYATTTGIVNTDTLKLRKEASTESAVLELLNLNQEIEVLKQEGDWYQIIYKGIKGYVHKDYVTVNKEVPKTENTVDNSTQAPVSNTVVEPTTQQTNPKEETTGEDNQNTEKQFVQDTQVRILPLIQADVLENVKKNTTVTIISRTGNWYYVATNENYGWVRKDTVGNIEKGNTNSNTNTPNNDEPKETPITVKTMYVNESSIYVRKGPSTNNDILTSLVRNAEVTVIAEVEDWYKVKVNGDTGYIAKRLLSDKKQETTNRGNVDRKEAETEGQATGGEQTAISNTTTTSSNQRQEVVNFAKQYLGCKYVYGASGPSTFDCSGFTMYVYRQFGITLSHSATAQSKKGTPVAKENLQPGDLVFFKDYETMDGIGHCGIYIGNGDFIHASSGTGYCVKISTLLSGSYERRYETARSVL